ncbi:MAG: NADH-quinone oxidoreductase subunit M [Thermoanaerobaculia bacterium]
MARRLIMETFLFLIANNTLTRVIFFPTLACLPLLFAHGRDQYIKVWTLVASLVQLGLTLALVIPSFGPGGAFQSLQELDRDGQVIDWIPRFGIRYELYLDGISMPLVVLTSLLLPLVVAGSWRGIQRNWRGYAVSLLLLTTGILGALVATDLFLFYVFWEVMLVPMYLLIGIWGSERRIYAAVKFFLFTMVGSLAMLLGIVWLAWTYRDLAGHWSFSLYRLALLDLPLEQQLWLFGAFGLAFAIKVPLVPLHTWLPDAHVEAPTGGSVMLAGILLKLGIYGFLRFALPLFPHAAQRAQPLLLALALVGILYGALVAWAQVDAKKLVAYSSVAHLGFVMLGLFAFNSLAWQGSLLQMINHGLSTGALFFLVGMIYDRRHTKLFDELGGLAKVMPWLAFFLVVSALASMGLPGLNGFVGEFLILIGTYQAGLVWPAILAAFGVVLAALYLLKMLSRTLWGPIRVEANQKLRDLSLREILIMAPLCLLMLAIGVAPESFLRPSRDSLDRVLAYYQSSVQRLPPAERRLKIVPAPPARSVNGDRQSERSEVQQ